MKFWSMVLVTALSFLVPLVLTPVVTWAQMGSATVLEVPFPFEVSGKLMPAGEYTLILGEVARLHGKTAGIIAPWNQTLRPTDDGLARLVFMKVGDQHYLQSCNVFGKAATFPIKDRELLLKAATKKEQVVITARR